MKNIDARTRIVESLLHVSDEARKEYERRLAVTYTKQGQNKSFIKQYLDGGGSELDWKFWSSISSSRLCFDLYSWLASEAKCLDFQFEYKLPKIGKLGTPNMDVFIETEDEIWFIESKFTELVNNHNFGLDLPEQYWKEVDCSGNDTPGGGFHTTKHEYRKTSILKRYQGDQELSTAFQEYCRMTNSKSLLLTEHDYEDWFDAKQETCHVLGVIMELRKRIKSPGFSKKVHLANIIYSFDEPVSSFAQNFIDRSSELVKRMTSYEDFFYDVFTVQDVINKYGGQPAYEAGGLSVKEQILQNFGPIYQ